MKGTIKVLDGTGHTTVQYDTDAGIVKQAELILRMAGRRGSAIFDAKTKEQVASVAGTTLNVGTVLSEHDELLVIPPMAGGSA